MFEGTKGKPERNPRPAVLPGRPFCKPILDVYHNAKIFCLGLVGIWINRGRGQPVLLIVTMAHVRRLGHSTRGRGGYLP